MNWTRAIVLLGACALTLGCHSPQRSDSQPQATRIGSERVTEGMTSDQVQEAWGEPDRVQRNSVTGEELWTYRERRLKTVRTRRVRDEKWHPVFPHSVTNRVVTNHTRTVELDAQGRVKGVWLQRESPRPRT